MGEVSVEIDLQRQIAFLLDNGRVLNRSPISSGRQGHGTPHGCFTVLIKDLNHYSATYGQIVDAHGTILVLDANSGMRVPAGARFIRAPMHYFMGFTPRHGMHAGYLPGYPASHGCVRMPERKAEEFYKVVSVGTPVWIHGTAP